MSEITLEHGPRIPVNKDLILFFTALVAFSLWFAATLSVPKKVEAIELRLNASEHDYAAMQGKMDVMADDIRDIKNILMRERD